jgi:hypothetical protein
MPAGAEGSAGLIGKLALDVQVPQTAISGGNPTREGNVVFNITPSSLSLGHVVSQLSAPPTNGGTGIMPVSFAYQNQATGERVSAGIPAMSTGAIGPMGISWMTWAVVAGGAVLAFVVLKKRRA